MPFAELLAIFTYAKGEWELWTKIAQEETDDEEREFSKRTAYKLSHICDMIDDILLSRLGV